MSQWEQWKKPGSGELGRLTEYTACMHYARYGWWPETFVAQVAKFHDGLVPARYLAVANRMRAMRAWDLPPDPDAGLCRVTLLERDGRIREVHVFRCEEITC